MYNRTFSGFAEYVRNGPELDRVISDLQPELILKWHMYNIEFDRLDERDMLPKTRREMIESMHPSMRDQKCFLWAIDSFFKTIKLYEQKQKWMNVEPMFWHRIAVNDEEKRKIAFLQKRGFIEKAGILIPRRDIVDFLTSGDEFYLLGAKDMKRTDELDIGQLRNRAYRLFVRRGTLASVTLLEAYGLQERVVGDLVKQFQERFDNATRLSKNIPSSRFEREIESWLLEERIPFMRHYPYRLILDKNCKPLMESNHLTDFTIFNKNGINIFEVMDKDDAFIHNPNYQRVREMKEQAVRRAGYGMHIIEPGDNWKPEFYRASKRAFFPGEVYQFEEPKQIIEISPITTTLSHRFRDGGPSRQNRHFWTLQQKIGYKVNH